MTLIEMMTAIAIFWIGLQGFTWLFIRSWQTNAYIFEMGQSSMAVSQGVNKIVSLIRKARQADNGSYPIKTADDNDLVLYSDYDKDGITERLHFYKSGNQIRMGITDPTGGIPKTYPADDEEVQTVASNIVNEDDEPVFYYYNRDYPGDQVNNPVATPADVSDIRLIKIFLRINIDPNRAPDNIQIQSFAELRNLNDYDRID